MVGNHFFIGNKKMLTFNNKTFAKKLAKVFLQKIQLFPFFSVFLLNKVVFYECLYNKRHRKSYWY